MKKNIITNKTKGFTIVELLVVIVVIGILAAISIVSYSGVTSRAKLTAALSTATSAKQVAETYFGENTKYPLNVSVLNATTNPINMPNGTTVIKGSAIFDSTGNTGKNVKYYICGDAAATDPTTTRPSEAKGAIITYYDASTKSEVGFTAATEFYPKTTPASTIKAYTGVNQKPILLGTAVDAFSGTGNFVSRADCYQMFETAS